MISGFVISPREMRVLDQHLHAGDAARDDFAIVELGELREARALGDDQADDVGPAGVIDLASRTS